VFVQLKDILKEKLRGYIMKWVLFLHDKSPAQGHLQFSRNWTTWVSVVFTTHPILRMWPRRYTTCSLD
jgi:hypothetical protein